jgi:hypothetical protein
MEGIYKGSKSSSSNSSSSSGSGNEMMVCRWSRTERKGRVQGGLIAVFQTKKQK